ncbi:hypothetical protein HYPSUDRAFT_937449 [Hypholoma sublateritium FD-334 SS-4]|uniref:Uncharacterized protein n=1 Tax=Hypholoma sublateritium (strain FD-334 SS-4) TaxID=945553 RepID=A0A0D2PFX4_HYPSF|nr:hypothetical protein HYPSUDRAFT_937449 [Hypholoma sublateritium FD-334 SS-4]
MLWWLPTFFILSSLRSTAAQAQASCLPFYSWASNSQNQSPCQVAASLLTVCNGSPFPVLPLPANSEYLGPTLQDANPCQCNTVTYSLMSACGACQGQDYVSWSVWTTNCATVYGNIFPEPIPSGVSVPGWAYLDVEAEGNFDQTNAKNNISRHLLQYRPRQAQLHRHLPLYPPNRPK